MSELEKIAAWVIAVIALACMFGIFVFLPIMGVIGLVAISWEIASDGLTFSRAVQWVIFLIAPPVMVWFGILPIIRDIKDDN